MATWTETVSRSTPAALVILHPVEIRAIGTAGSDFEIELIDDPELNPVLVHKFTTDFALDIPQEKLDDIQDIAVTAGADAAVERFRELVGGAIPGFSISSRRVLANFSYVKLPMVRDLETNLEAIAAHDVVAAIAGDADATMRLRERNAVEVPIDLPDFTAPSDEFLVLTADSSQNLAINRALSGTSLVIQGPPGTGKSQTISNLLAALAARGQRTLFVAEKRAAIDAVIGRLRAVGLGEIVMDVHSRAASRRQVAEELRKSLEMTASSVLPNQVQLHRRLTDRRDRLRSYVAALHEVREPWGMSLYDAQVELAGIRDDARLDFRFSEPQARALGGEQALAAVEELHRFAGLGGIPGPTSPWFECTLRTPDDVSAVLDAAGALAGGALDALVHEAQAVAASLAVDVPATVNEVAALIALVDQTNALLSVADGRIFELDLDRLSNEVARGGLFRRFSSEFRDARRQLDAVVHDPRSVTSVVNDARSIATMWREVGARVPVGPVSVDDLRRAHQLVMSSVTDLQRRSSAPALADQMLVDLRAGASAMVADRVAAQRQPSVWECHDRLVALDLSGLLSAMVSSGLTLDRASDVFRFCWLESWRERVMLTQPDIRDLASGYHDQLVDEYRATDREHIESTRDRVRRAVAENVVAVREAYPDQSTLVRSEAHKKRRHMPMRRLFRQAPDVITAVKPCWVMSPLEVSQLLPGDRPYFDVVVFDEASQVTPADAIPAIARGARVVVAGDRHQLPPTAFFQGSTEDDAAEGDDEYADIVGGTVGFESILDVLTALLPFRSLEWHYRSRD